MAKVINKLLAVTLSFAMVLTGFTFLGGSFATYADDGDKPEFVIIERGETEFLPASGGTCSWYAMDGNYMGLNGQVTEADFKLQVKTADADWADASVGSLALQPDEEEFDVIVTATIPENADAVQKEWRVVYKYSEIGTQYETENAIKVTQDAAADTPSEKPDFVIIDRDDEAEEFQPASGGKYVWLAMDGNWGSLCGLVDANDFTLRTKKAADNEWADATVGSLKVEDIEEGDYKGYVRVEATIPDNTDEFDKDWTLAYKHSDPSTQYPTCESVKYTQIGLEPEVEKPELVEIIVDSDETQPAADGEYAWFIWTDGDFEDAAVSGDDFTMQVKSGDGDWTDSDAAVAFELGTNYDEGLVTATIPDNEEEVAKQWRFVYAGGGVDCPAITQEAYEEPVVEWTKDDFTTSGSAVTGLTESGTAKLDANTVVTFPADEELDTINMFLGGTTKSKANQKVTGVVIPDNYTTIAMNAFKNCANLTEATLGNGLKTINNAAFQSTGLTSLVVPSSVETIGISAFATSTLTSLTLSEGNLRTINSGAFANAKLETVNLPSKVEVLDVNAFGNQTDKSKRVVIIPAEGANYPEGVVKVGKGHIFEGYVLDIALDANGGDELGTKSVKADKTSTLWSFKDLPTPKKEGFVLKGWFTAAEGGDEVTAETVFEEACTIYAQWTKEFTVTFDKNAEDAVLDVTSAKTDKDGKVALPVPTREGKVFAGWFTAAEAGDKVDSDKVYDQDMTLFAHWDDHYTVTFDANLEGATVDPAKAETNDLGKLEIALPTPKKAEGDEHIFTGWYLEDGTAVSADTAYTSDTVVKAGWTDKNWTAEDFEYGVWEFNEDLMIDGAAWKGNLWAVTGLKDSAKAKLAAGSTDVVIPAKDPEGKTVQGVKASFSNMGITSVSFPEGVYNDEGRGDFFIAGNTFNNNNIAELTLPEGIVYVGAYAFRQNKLESVTFPKSLMTISSGAFMGNGSLDKAVFPEEGAKLGIGSNAFAACGFKDIQLPKTIVMLSASAFTRNPEVVKVYIDGKGQGGNIEAPNANSHEIINGLQKNKLTFEANGGTVVPAEIEFTYGKIDSFLPMPVKENSAFLGWFTAEEGGGLVEGQIFAQEDATLYAHWSDNAELVDVQQKTIDAVSSTLDAAEANEAAKNAAKGDAAVKAAAAAKKAVAATLAKANEAKEAADALVAKMDADESVDKAGEEYAAAKKAAADAAKAVDAAKELAGEADAIQAQANKDAQAMYAPGKVKLKKAAKGKKRVTATWKTIKKDVTGYQVEIVNKKTGKVVVTKNFKQTKKLAKKSTFKKVVKSKKLKKGKYSVRVRAYRTVGGVNYYGAWSNKKSVKLK